MTRNDELAATIGSVYGVLRQGLDCDVAVLAAAEVADLSEPPTPSPHICVESLSDAPTEAPTAAPDVGTTPSAPVVRVRSGAAGRAFLRLFGPLLRPIIRRCRAYLIGDQVVELEPSGFGRALLRTLEEQSSRLRALEVKVVQYASAIETRLDDLDRHQTSLHTHLAAQIRARSDQAVAPGAVSESMKVEHPRR